MGCAASTEMNGEPAEAPIRKQNSRDKSSTSPRKLGDNTIRVVLIGPGESGKSTVMKQMRLLEAKEKGKSSCWTDVRDLNFLSLSLDSRTTLSCA